jgi:hypothetical protein
LEWDTANITHVTRHNINPDELEEAVFLIITAFGNEAEPDVTTY